MIKLTNGADAFPVLKKSKDGDYVVVFTEANKGFCIVHPRLPIDGVIRAFTHHKSEFWSPETTIELTSV